MTVSCSILYQLDKQYPGLPSQVPHRLPPINPYAWPAPYSLSPYLLHELQRLLRITKSRGLGPQVRKAGAEELVLGWRRRVAAGKRDGENQSTIDVGARRRDVEVQQRQ